MKTLFKVVKTIVNVVVILLVLLFVLVVCLQRFSNNEISFLNFRLFTVVSGSMEPVYSIGDVLLAKEVDAEDIEVGDSISYLGTSGQFKDKVITHEVIQIEKDNEGKFLFHTKGKANLTEDPIVKEEQVFGKIVYEAHILSFIYGIVSKPMGMFFCVIIPLFYIIGSEFLSFLLDKEEDRREKLKEKNKKSKKTKKTKEE